MKAYPCMVNFFDKAVTEEERITVKTRLQGDDETYKYRYSTYTEKRLPLTLLLNLLFCHFNRSEPTYRSQRISASRAMHYKEHFSHVSLETEYNEVCIVNYTILRG